MDVAVIVVLMMTIGVVGWAATRLGRERGPGATPRASPQSAERMDLLRERLETVMDAARAAERETQDIRARFSTLTEDVDTYKKQLGGRYGQLSRRIQDLEAHTAAMAIHQGRGVSDSGGIPAEGSGDGMITDPTLFDPTTQVR